MKRYMLFFSSVVSAVSMAAAGISVENESMSIHFSQRGSGFAVTAIVNRISGETRFVNTDCRAPDFWDIRLVKGGGADSGREVRLQNHTPSRERIAERLADGYAFEWRGLSIPGGEKECVDVRAEVRLPKGSAASEWTISVKCRSRNWALKETRYPCLRGVVGSGEADVLMPCKGFGARLYRAYDTEKGAIGTFGYPGWNPMVAAYMKGGKGLYFAAHDPAGRNKSIIFDHGATVCFATPVEDSGVVGKAAEGPRFAVTVAAFKGDWWNAAHIYRDWAVRQKWCAKGKKAVRGDYPKAMADIDVWVLGGGPPAEVSNAVANARSVWPDLNLAYHWYKWNIQPFDTHYPEYLAQRGVKETGAWMNSIGVLSMPYINGRLWDQSLASAPYAWCDACKRPNGDICREGYNDRTFAVMCPCAKGWQRILLYNATNTVAECSAGALYYDQIACSRPQLCFNPGHGHPLGGGSWWVDGYRTALEPMHAALSRKGVPITSEGMAESWIDCIDGYLMCEALSGEDVPFYPAVYSAYATYFGSRLYPYGFPVGFSDAFFFLQVRSLLWGVIPGWCHRWVFARNREEFAKTMHAVGRVRHAARYFIAYGTLEDELRTVEPLPEATFSWKQLRRKTKDQFDMYSQTVQAIIGNVWTSHDGARTAVAAANVSRSAATARFRLPPGATALVPVVIPGMASPACSVSGGIGSLTLAPRQIAVVECR